MRTRGLVKIFLAVGLAFAMWSEGAHAIPLAGGMRGQNVTKISNDRGGYVIQYAMRLQKLKQAGTSVQFAGPCLSACTLYLALPTSQTCISRRASFSFHAAYGAGPRGNAIATSYMFNQYPDWVRSWISNNGGLSRRLITMRYDYAAKFMKPCKGTTLTAENTARGIWKRGVKAQQPATPRRNFAKATSL